MKCCWFYIISYYGHHRIINKLNQSLVNSYVRQAFLFISFCFLSIYQSCVCRVLKPAAFTVRRALCHHTCCDTVPKTLRKESLDYRLSTEIWLSLGLTFVSWSICSVFFPLLSEAIEPNYFLGWKSSAIEFGEHDWYLWMIWDENYSAEPSATPTLSYLQKNAVSKLLSLNVLCNKLFYW